MNEYLIMLIQKYKQKGLLIDTNILLLYVVGAIDIKIIKDFKRTAIFTENDFYSVSKFIDYFDVKITTPHILKETSNLFGNKENLQVALKTYIELAKENFLESKQIANTRHFLHFGLADTAINEIAKDSYLVVTDDNKLFGYLQNQKVDVVNLEQIRMI